MIEATSASFLESVKATNKANKDIIVAVEDKVLDDSHHLPDITTTATYQIGDFLEGGEVPIHSEQEKTTSLNGSSHEDSSEEEDDKDKVEEEDDEGKDDEDKVEEEDDEDKEYIHDK
jgi:hypothetical protein